MMILKPDEVTYLKKGKKVSVEIKEGDVRTLKRNFCGVYELYRNNNPLVVEYFEELTLFKNRYGHNRKRFNLYNISKQRLDIYPVAEASELKDIFKWFSEYGKIVYKGSKEFDDMEIDYYSWISEMDNTASNFQVLHQGNCFTFNISVRNSNCQTA